jgi:hypothetical protein
MVQLDQKARITMYTVGECLLEGLSAKFKNSIGVGEVDDGFLLRRLAEISALAVSSEMYQATKPRNELRQMRDDGRRLLHAADERKKAAAAPKAICGNASSGTPCEGMNIRDCAGCLGTGISGECEA